MNTWWKMTKYSSSPVPHEVARETEKFLVLPGDPRYPHSSERRVAKTTSWEKWFPTRLEALQWALERKRDLVESLGRQLSIATSEMYALESAVDEEEEANA